MCKVCPLKAVKKTFIKRKTSIALKIRLAVFLAVTLSYFLSNFYFNSFLSSSSYGFSNGRKLLNSECTEALSTVEKNCTPSAIKEFPSDGLTQYQRKHGWILVHILISCYCFCIIAVTCDEYFIPAIEVISHNFNMKEDVAAATFMAAALSSPELFINCIGTFITKGDIGVGTIVGSAVFNVLAVPACCGILARQLIDLDWWPVSRDCLIYCFAVIGLIATLQDGKVMWYEAIFLVLGYVFYILVMYYNDAIAYEARKLISKLKQNMKVNPFQEVNELTPILMDQTRSQQNSLRSFTNLSSLEVRNLGFHPSVNDRVQSVTVLKDLDDETMPCSNNLTDFVGNPWTKGDKKHFLFALKWPIAIMLWATIPDCRKRPRLQYLTFVMSIVWICGISYIVAFLITIIGDTFNIPDSIMGLTILSAGLSVPEAVSSILVTNQGRGAMGISNSIGSNTFDILLCLGLPWFIKAFFVPNIPDEYSVNLNSAGLTYAIISLLTTLFGFYFAFALNKFRLDWKIGVVCSVMYMCFLVFAVMIESNIFFTVNLPICNH